MVTLVFLFELVYIGEVITIAYGQEKAMDCRDAMAKALYGRAFNWIVNKINILLGGPDGQHQQKTVSIGTLQLMHKHICIILTLML